MADQQNIIKQHKDFNMYLEYVLENNFPKIKREDYGNIIDQQLKEELKIKVHEDSLNAQKEKLKEEGKQLIKERQEFEFNNEWKIADEKLMEEIRNIRKNEDTDEDTKEELIRIERKKHRLLLPSLTIKYKEKL